MEEIIGTIALAPFYGIAVAASWYGVAYMAHKLQKLDASATETQLTETTSPASTQQK
jgi:hypothetical protein